MARKIPEIKPAKYEEIKNKVESIGLDIFKVVNGEHEILQAPDDCFDFIHNGEEVRGKLHLFSKEQHDDDEDTLGIIIVEGEYDFTKEKVWVDVPEVNDVIAVEDGKLAVTTP